MYAEHEHPMTLGFITGLSVGFFLAFVLFS